MDVLVERSTIQRRIAETGDDVNFRTKIASRASAAMAIAMAVLLAPTPATAGSGKNRGCQGPSAELVYVYYSPSNSNTVATWKRNCSDIYSLNSQGRYLHSGGWSGYITFSTGETDYFCDGWSNIPLYRQRVVEIEMASSRIWECGG
ncbi:hypothetical protein AB0J82_21955 [Asanoa sp. NPDC049518]|uniref:hypothetical protein n=1 Tax=unclassified Asanoa TaxID=2685164 RepID=UPI00343B3A5A